MNPLRAARAGTGPRPAGPISTLAVAAAFVAGYVALDHLSYIHPLLPYGITPWNPQPALAIALLMVRGQRWLPVVLLAVVAAELLVRSAPTPWYSTLLIAAVLSLGYAAIARALTGPYAVDPALGTRRDVFRLVAVATVGALVTGALYIAALAAAGTGPSVDLDVALARFWIGEAVGILVTLPPLLMLSLAPRRAEIRAMFGRAETVAYVAAVALAQWLVFERPVSEQFKFFYVMFLPLVWISTRFGMVGAALTALATQAVLIVEVQLGAYQAVTVFELQAFLIALTVTGLFLGVAVDERKRAAEELRQSLRMAAAGEMAASLAHELNQPLTALANYGRASQMLARGDPADTARLHETLDKLVAEAGRAGEVVRRLRDFFRTGATELRAVALADLAARAVAEAGPRAADLGVALEFDATPRGQQQLDEVQIQVVLRNLLANALDAAAAGPPPRRVRLDVRADVANAVRVTVRDSGTGVRATDAERIFEPFTTTRATGMGMGLAIGRAIVEAHGGRLWAEPGPHGVFSFTLPAHDAAHG